MTTSNSKPLRGQLLSRRWFLFLPLFVASIALFIAAIAPAGAARSEMGAKPTVLTLGEFLELRGQKRGPLIIYFNQQQWGNLTRDLKPSDGKAPGAGARLVLTTLPGLPGGFVEARCPVGNLGMGAEGEPRCEDKPDVDFHEPERPGVRICGMKVHKNGEISCHGICQGFGTCKKKSYGINVNPGGMFSALLVLCQCQA